MLLIEEHMPHIEHPRIACLASGNASSFRRIVQAIEQGKLDAEAVLLISSKSTAPALDFAREHNIPALHISSVTEGSTKAANEKILRELLAAAVDLFILSGYIPFVDNAVLDSFLGINIHPSLLPKHGGKDMHGPAVHQAVLDAGEQTTGATIHIVTGKLDGGAIIAQQVVQVDAGDTAETLGARVQAIEPHLMLTVMQEITRRERP